MLRLDLRVGRQLALHVGFWNAELKLLLLYLPQVRDIVRSHGMALPSEDLSCAVLALEVTFIVDRLFIVGFLLKSNHGELDCSVVDGELVSLAELASESRAVDSDDVWVLLGKLLVIGEE